MFNQEAVEHVLRPGNLVWGMPIEGDLWQSVLERGITSPKRANSYPGARDIVCMGLLPKDVTPVNSYLNSNHHGPKGENFLGYHWIGVVLSRQKLMEAVPAQSLRAVGGLFNRRFGFHNSLYDYSDSPRRVFDIPIESDEPCYPDEVRFYPNDDVDSIRVQDVAEGIIVSTQSYHLLAHDTKKAGLVLNIPVLSFNGWVKAEGLG
jgi:hypothetical protein